MRAKKIISGGQSGVDRGSLDACLEKNFNCGGWCPEGRRAEDGKIDDKYPLTETMDCNYDTRTKLNVRDSDATLIISPEKITGGTLLTRQICNELNKPVLTVNPEYEEINALAVKVTGWINTHNISILNVAGPRKSEWDEGYETSYRLIKNLITKLEESTSG